MRTTYLILQSEMPSFSTMLFINSHKAAFPPVFSYTLCKLLSSFVQSYTCVSAKNKKKQKQKNMVHHVWKGGGGRQIQFVLDYIPLIRV